MAKVTRKKNLKDVPESPKTAPASPGRRKELVGNCGCGKTHTIRIGVGDIIDPMMVTAYCRDCKTMVQLQEVQ